MVISLPPADLGQAVTAIAAIIAAIIGIGNRRNMNDLHVLINSRLDQLLKLTRDSSFAEGLADRSPQKRKAKASASAGAPPAQSRRGRRSAPSSSGKSDRPQP
jgi:hypothetical protein